jgi:hypothetical protein
MLSRLEALRSAFDHEGGATLGFCGASLERFEWKPSLKRRRG